MFRLLNNERCMHAWKTCHAAGYYLGQNSRKISRFRGRPAIRIVYAWRCAGTMRRLPPSCRKPLTLFPLSSMPRFSIDGWRSPLHPFPTTRLLWKIVLPLIVVLVIVGCWALLLAREIRSRRRAETNLRTAQEDLEKINTELEPGYASAPATLKKPCMTSAKARSASVQ